MGLPVHSYEVVSSSRLATKACNYLMIDSNYTDGNSIVACISNLSYIYMYHDCILYNMYMKKCSKVSCIHIIQIKVLIIALRIVLRTGTV